MPVRDTSAISQPSGNERRDWHQARTPRRAHLGPVELYTPKGEKPRVLRRHLGHDVVAQRDVPPRVGRVPAVVAYGSWPHVAVGPGLAQTDRRDGADAALERLGAPGPQAEDAQAAGVGGSRANVLAADVRANRDFLRRRAHLPPLRAHRAQRRKRGRRVEEHDDDHRPRADLHQGRPRPTASRRVLSRQLRGVLRAADVWADHGIEIDAAPSKHAIAPGASPLRHPARRQPASRSPPAGASSSRRMSPARSGPRPSAPRARRGASRRSSPSTRYGHPGPPARLRAR